MSNRPAVGSVVLLTLSSGRYAFGRVLRDGSIGIYRATADDPKDVPTADSPYRFVVGIYDPDLGTLPVVAYVPFATERDSWPPPSVIRDAISGQSELYEFGMIRPLPAGMDPADHEPAAAWSLEDILKRIEAL
jgi:hypothetical protein